MSIDHPSKVRVLTTITAMPFASSSCFWRWNHMTPASMSNEQPVPGLSWCPLSAVVGHPYVPGCTNHQIRTRVSTQHMTVLLAVDWGGQAGEAVLRRRQASCTHTVLLKARAGAHQFLRRCKRRVLLSHPAATGVGVRCRLFAAAIALEVKKAAASLLEDAVLAFDAAAARRVAALLLRATLGNQRGRASR